MRVILLILASLCVMPGAIAQERDSGPFTRWEVVQLTEVWPEIRVAANFEDINWEALGLRGPPGDTRARRLMEEHWGDLRRAENFGDIDWEATTGYQASTGYRAGDPLFGADRSEGADRSDQFDPFGQHDEWGPFTEEEAEEMSEAWPEIRSAARFEDINWSQTGLRVAPGDAEARMVMARYWNELRQEPRFADIDWDEYGY